MKLRGAGKAVLSAAILVSAAEAMAVSLAAASPAAEASPSCREAEWRRFLDPPPGYASFPRQVRKTASYVRNGLVVERYEQANGPGTRQRVMLALPEGASGRLPAVVVPFYFPEAMLGFNPVDGSQCVTGLVDRATNLAYYASITYMADLARRGYATISADAYYLTYAMEGRPNDDWGKWDHAGRALSRDWPGWTGIGKLAFDTRLLVDMLVADDRVDASRIGILGHSLGGKMSFYAGCLDKRIKVVVASDFGIGWDQTNWQDVWYWGGRLSEIRGTGATHADLLTMAHGKPFCLIAGQYDNDDSGRIMRMAKGYEARPDLLVLVNHATGHRPPPEATEAGYRFLDRFLKGGAGEKQPPSARRPRKFSRVGLSPGCATRRLGARRIRSSATSSRTATSASAASAQAIPSARWSAKRWSVGTESRTPGKPTSTLRCSARPLAKLRPPRNSPVA